MPSYTEFTAETFNLDDLPDAPPAIPEGEYRVRILEADKKTSQTGNPYIRFSVQIMDGEFAGRMVYSIWSLKPEQLYRFKGDLKRLGFSGNFSLDQLVGVEAIAQIQQRENSGNGQLENSVRKFLRAE